MNLKIQSIHFHADKKLHSLLEKRIHKLSTFYQPILHGEVFLKVEKADDQENKQVEIRLHVPGSKLFAKEQAQSFEVAASAATESLRRQLRKLKGKQAH